MAPIFLSDVSFLRLCPLSRGGKILWNAGIAPTPLAMLEPMQVALDGAQTDLGFMPPDSAPGAAAETILIDDVVMKRADNLLVGAYGVGGNHLGCWDAVKRETGSGDTSVATVGAVTAIDCADIEGLTAPGFGVNGLQGHVLTCVASISKDGNLWFKPR